jgi:hypothetical protein
LEGVGEVQQQTWHSASSLCTDPNEVSKDNSRHPFIADMKEHNASLSSKRRGLPKFLTKCQKL